MAMIMKLYSRHYEVEQLWSSPTDCGHSGVARDRTYLILWHREKVEKTYSPQDLYQDCVLSYSCTERRTVFVILKLLHDYL
jgi:hypothetical protein